MLVALQNVLSPEVNKVLQGTPDLNDLAGTLIFSPKLNALLVDVGYSALSNDRTAGISSAILKKVLDRLKRLNFYAPPAFLLSEHRFHFGNCHRRSEASRMQSRAEQPQHRTAPQTHQDIWMVVHAPHPRTR